MIISIIRKDFKASFDFGAMGMEEFHEQPKVNLVIAKMNKTFDNLYNRHINRQKLEGIKWKTIAQK